MAEIFKCKNCGASVDLSKAISGVIECGYCFSKFTVPKKEASPAALDFLRHGEHDLDTGKFDDAYIAFNKAAELDGKEPEAYWGMALAEFKVQYLKDGVNNRLQPICHEVIDKSFTQNKNYLNALKFSTAAQREQYEAKGNEIDYIRSEFLKLKQSGIHYDCFICVKVSRVDGEQTDKTKKNWTEDAYDADAIYDLLKRNGFTPFFSEREIRGRTGADYEAMILYALHTSETMLVVCRNSEYLQTPWVKNEYTRFKKLVNDSEKENDSLTIVYNGAPIEKLPGFSGKIQGIDYGRRSADFEIINFVKEHTPLARAKREEEKRKKEGQAEEIRRQIEAQKKAQQELEQRLKNLNPNVAAGTSSTVETLLTRANQEMEAKSFAKAKNFFETVLERAPENSAAWWGLVLIDNNCSSDKQLLSKLNGINVCDGQSFSLLYDLRENKNYRLAKKFATEQTKEKIQAVEDCCENKKAAASKTVNKNAKAFYEKLCKADADKPYAVYALFSTFLVDFGCASAEGMLKKINACTPTADGVDFINRLLSSDMPQRIKKCGNKELNETVDTLQSALAQKAKAIKESVRTEHKKLNNELYNWGKKVTSYAGGKNRPGEFKLFKWTPGWGIGLLGGILGLALGFVAFCLLCGKGQWLCDIAPKFGFLEPVISWLGKDVFLYLVNEFKHLGGLIDLIIVLFIYLLVIICFLIAGIVILIIAWLVLKLLLYLIYLFLLPLRKARYNKKMQLHNNYESAVKNRERTEKYLSDSGHLKEITEKWGV